MATWCGATSLPAQSSNENRESQLWNFQGLRAGYCVRFLMEPKDAAGKLKGGFRPIRADRDSALHPALKHVIQSQPELAAWTASRVCFYFADTVQVGGRRVAEKDPRKYQMLSVWSVPAEPARTTARREVALDLYASRSSLIRAAEAGGIRLRDAHSVVADRADTTSDIYSVKLERTLLVWHGRPTGDSTRVADPIREFWHVAGLRGGVWTGRLVLRPAWTRLMVGSLTIEGKGDLAKSLKASPIRFVGPLFYGGGGELGFSR